MFSQWYSRLISTAAAFALGAGVLFISGCGDDCCSDSEDSHSATAVNSDYETQNVSYSNGSTSATQTADQNADLRSDARARGTWNGDNASQQDTQKGPVESTVKGATNTAGEAVHGAEQKAGNVVHGVFGN
jgi:hypothetical protein